jgi:hypothetical protein
MGDVEAGQAFERLVHQDEPDLPLGAPRTRGHGL